MGKVLIEVTEETRRWLRLLSAIKEKPMYEVLEEIVEKEIEPYENIINKE